MRVVKTVAAWVLLAALLGGVPALLIAWGHPLALVRADWRTVLLRPVNEEILLALLSVAGWLAWALLTVTAIVELTRHASRGRIRIHLPGIRWLQPAVGGLIAMMMTPALPGQADESDPPASVQAPAQAEQASSPPATTPPLPETAGAGQRCYVVQPGDELWSVAEHELGTGASWRTIVAENPGMTADTALIPGRTILLPTAPPSHASAPPSSGRRVTVQRGDTLWDLAAEHLGDAHRWPELFRANRDQISHPDEIDVGWSLRLPIPTAIPPQEPEPEARTHTTQQSDPSPAEEQGSPPSPLAPTPTARGTGTAGPVDSAENSPTLDTDRVEDSSWRRDILGPVGGVLAASVFAGVIARRRVQLLQRGLGRRITPLAPEVQRFLTALVQRTHEATDPPPDLQPTSVIVGWRDEGDVLVAVERQRCMLVAGSQEHTSAMTATVLTSLLCAPWSSTTQVVTVQPHEDWALALDDPRLSSETDLEEALSQLQRLCAQRRIELGHQDLGALRDDENRAGAWAPVVFVFCEELLPAHIDRVHDALSLGEVGVSVVAAVAPDADDPSVHLRLTSQDTALLTGDDRPFQPQLINRPARRAVLSLFASSLDDHGEPAPWWRDGDPAPTVTVLPHPPEDPIKDDAMPAWSTHPNHPTLMVLGPVELQGCHGERPGRAVGQCMEYCAWLLLNPGSTPRTMVRELLVAEGTRRSNTSRLRSWLGRDPVGAAYLPDAYSGRICLHPEVTSDWERFQLLLAGGVNTASSPLLREALSLVRGRPLDGVAFQWPWVAQWLADMLAMISDAAAVLADRCLTDRDIEGALWAIDHGQLATGDDEVLAIRRIHALALSGEKAELDRAVMDLTRTARGESRDLAPESIQRIQHALHLSTSQHTRP